MAATDQEKGKKTLFLRSFLSAEEALHHPIQETSI
jgi:hypothetical protein